MPPPPGQLSKEAHAGFAHVASMLTGQGIVDPLGEQHMTSVIVAFFEARMVSTVHMLDNRYKQAQETCQLAGFTH